MKAGCPVPVFRSFQFVPLKAYTQARKIAKKLSPIGSDRSPKGSFPNHGHSMRIAGRCVQTDQILRWETIAGKLPPLRASLRIEAG